MDSRLELGRKGCRYRLRCEQSHGPPCPHGPTLPFDRLDADGRVTASFYACSACRDRKQCNFYLPLSEASPPPGQRKRDERAGPAEAGSGALSFSSHRSCYDRLQLALQQPHETCQYCHDCDVTLVGTAACGSQQKQQQQGALHGRHRLALLNADTAQRPTTILSPKENNKSNAQFFFTSVTTDFLVACLRRLQVERLVCIGTPRLHEAISTQQCSNSKSNGGRILSSFLLDLDGRFRHFFGPHEFAQYNMFNHHFFAGSLAEQSFAKFCSSGSGKAAIVVDPPYGGMLEALDATLRKVTGLLLAAGGVPQPHGSDAEVADSGIALCFLLLPYYLEPQVLAHLGRFSMLDYRASYENHAKYSNREASASSSGGGEARRRPPLHDGRHASAAAARSSPARVFTNVRPDLVELPATEGYRFCIACRRWTWPENKHCERCNACTTKHGPTYVHCPECDRCVKPSWKHCSTCGKCTLSGEGSRHACGQAGLPPAAGACGDSRPRRGKRKGGGGGGQAWEQQLQPLRKRLQKRQKAAPC